MSNLVKKNCGLCRYLNKSRKTCHRFPPQVVSDMDGGYFSAFPVIQKPDLTYCFYFTLITKQAEGFLNYIEKKKGLPEESRTAFKSQAYRKNCGALRDKPAYRYKHKCRLRVEYIPPLPTGKPKYRKPEYLPLPMIYANLSRPR